MNLATFRPIGLVVAVAVAAACAAPAAPTTPSGASPAPSAHAAASDRPHVHADHKHDDPSTASGDSAPAPVGHRFERADEWSKIFDDPARDAWQRPADVVRLMRIAEGMTVADIGAGTGYFEPYLSKAVGSRGVVIAIDIEPDMVRFLRERAERQGMNNVRPTLARTDDPGLAPESVDRILIADTWHHIPAREAYSRKLGAALEPGGFVAIVDYTMATRRGPPKHHRITPEQVRDELRAGGLSPEIVTENLPDHYVVFGHREKKQ